MVHKFIEQNMAFKLQNMNPKSLGGGRGAATPGGGIKQRPGKAIHWGMLGALLFEEGGTQWSWPVVSVPFIPTLALPELSLPGVFSRGFGPMLLLR